MRKEWSLLALLALSLVGCNTSSTPAPLLGDTAWDRISLIAPASEPLSAVHVAQGDTVIEGQLLAELDPRRARARLDQAQAEVARATAALEEALNGARPETLNAARSNLASLKATTREALREQQRVSDLVTRRLAPESEADRVSAAAQRAEAAQAAAEARLRELLEGTRVEQLAQAEAALAASQALLRLAELGVEELQIRAPRAGRIDALPFEAGDRPAAGAGLATLLVGDAPFARIFVPASLRGRLAPGDRFRIRIEGLQDDFTGTLREISAEPAFTPYFALSGDDASQLVYRAEIVMDGPGAAQLPGGLPLQATLLDER